MRSRSNKGLLKTKNNWKLYYSVNNNKSSCCHVLFVLSCITSIMFLSSIPLIMLRPILGLSYCLGLGKFHCQSFVAIFSSPRVSMDICLLVVEVSIRLLIFSLCKLREHIARATTPKPTVVGCILTVGPPR